VKGLWVELGLIDYGQAFDLQRRIAEFVASGQLPDTVLTLEHPSVYTLGAGFHAANLPLPASIYAQRGVEIHETDRGGDITYHGPDQLVGYPIFDLNRHGRDLHRWLRGLEQTVIETIGEFGVEGVRNPPHTGVWVEDRKICAIGIKVKRWVSIHGIALNCDNDLSPFDWIVPCGIRGCQVTSLERETSRRISREEGGREFVRRLGAHFDLEFELWTRRDFEAMLDRLDQARDGEGAAAETS
jgi:lipoate-protein ligase B